MGSSPIIVSNCPGGVMVAYLFYMQVAVVRIHFGVLKLVYSSAWLERLADTEKVVGSNPTTPTKSFVRTNGGAPDL